MSHSLISIFSALTVIYLLATMHKFCAPTIQGIFKIAKSLKEDKELIEAGFEYGKERDRVKIYRKSK